MTGVLGRGLFFMLILACAAPARADPLLSFLLSIAQEMAVKAIERRLAMPQPEPEVYGGTTVQPAHLKQLIQDSFLYLAEDQRSEIFEALNAELLKPENYAIRAPIIEYFAERALQVRAAQLRLSQLSSFEMRALADELRKEIRAMPTEELQKLKATLESGLLPVPADLNRHLLAAFD